MMPQTAHRRAHRLARAEGRDLIRASFSHSIQNPLPTGVERIAAGFRQLLEMRPQAARCAFAVDRRLAAETRVVGGTGLRDARLLSTERGSGEKAEHAGRNRNTHGVPLSQAPPMCQTRGPGT
jgi:hypothetical protein